MFRTDTSIYLHPTNSAMRFPENDPFVKYMLDFAEELGPSTFHGQTGPKLVTKTLKKFPDYNQYLKHFNTHCMLGWDQIGDYTEPPEKLLNKININEVIGFHINNAVFERFITNENPNGVLEILKKCILNSNTREEYNNYLKEYKILDSNLHDIIKDWDLKYLDINNNNFINSFKYTLLIDSTKLKKVEIYNIIHSITIGCENNLSNDFQIIIFGKTNMCEDKIKFKANVMFLTSDFKNIYLYIREYVYGDHIIPINQPIIFRPEFFKEKTIEAEVENYVANNDLFINIIDKKDFWTLLYRYGPEKIFNLTGNMISDLNAEIFDEKEIFTYGTKSEKTIKLMQIIDSLDNVDIEDITSVFLKSKSELMELEFNNLIGEVSYHYYSSYMNIIRSSTFHEYKLKEQNTRLSCLNGFYLNKFNNKYDS